MPITTKTIYIVRHGETDYNKAGIVQGSGVNAPLNTLGMKQAAMFYEAYNQVVFDKVYTSTLLRTHQTAQLFIDQNIPWQQHHGLNEINWGSREGKLPDTAANLIFEKITEQWNLGHTHLAFDGGESPQQVAARQQEFWNQMLAQTSEQTVLIAMHGRAMKILLAQLLHNDLSKMDQYEHSNLCLYVLHYHYNSQEYQLKLANCTAHLQK
jgi:broad specificity phosphatase PhoE